MVQPASAIRRPQGVRFANQGKRPYAESKQVPSTGTQKVPAHGYHSWAPSGRSNLLPDCARIVPTMESGRVRGMKMPLNTAWGFLDPIDTNGGAFNLLTNIKDEQFVPSNAGAVFTPTYHQ